MKKCFLLFGCWIMVECLSFIFDIFHTTYCKPVSYTLNTVILRIVTRQSTMCTISEKIHEVIDKYTHKFMIDFLHLLLS